MRQTDRDLVLNLYRTTGQWARLLHHLRISTIDERRVDDLATAFLASVNITFERWGSIRSQVQAASGAVTTLDDRNEKILETATKSHSTVLHDLVKKVNLDKREMFTELPAASNLWGLLRGPSAVSRHEARGFLDSLEAAQETAIRSKYALADINSRLVVFDGPLKEWEDRFVGLQAITKSALLEDWKQHESSIDLKAAAWRQHLVARYNAKQWFLIYASAYVQDKAIYTWRLLEMLSEPLFTALLIDSINPLSQDGAFCLPHVIVVGFAWFAQFVFF